jgi:lipoprotein signal peptidase
MTEKARKPKKPLLSLIAILVMVVLIDQVTKQWAHHALLDKTFFAEEGAYPVCGNKTETINRERFIARHRENRDVINGFFKLRYVENCASAFGLMGGVPEGFRFPFFIIVSIAALLFIPYLYNQTSTDQRLMLYGLPFILGGAIGNLLDRVIFRYVIDFIEWYVTVDGVEKHWPTFNVADAAIVVGIALMVLEMMPIRQRRSGAKEVRKGREGETTS